MVGTWEVPIPPMILAMSGLRGRGRCKLLRRFLHRFLARILEVREAVDLDVHELSVLLLDAPYVDGLDDVAGLGVDLYRPARALRLIALEELHRLVGIHLASELLHHLRDRRHPVVA